MFLWWPLIRNSGEKCGPNNIAPLPRQKCKKGDPGVQRTVLLNAAPVPAEGIEPPFTDYKSAVIAVILSRQYVFIVSTRRLRLMRPQTCFLANDPSYSSFCEWRWFRYRTPNRLSLRHTSQIATLGFIGMRTPKGLYSCGGGNCTRGLLGMNQAIFC